MVPMKHCKNCYHILKGNYCSNCGQKATTGRITFRYLLEIFLQIFTHLEHGFLYTSKELLIRPGITMHDYLTGHRKKLESTIGYIVVWAGLEWLIRKGVINLFGYKFLHSEYETPEYEQVRFFYDQHSSWFVFIIVPFVATIIYLLMGKPRYNLAEITAVTIYGFGTYHILQLFSSTILLGIIFQVNIRSWQIGVFYNVIGAVWIFWSSYDFFKIDHLNNFWLRLIGCCLLTLIVENALVLFLPLVFFRIANIS